MILRRGGFVMLRNDRGQAGLLRAAEFADYIPDPVAHLVQSNEILCLTARHLQAFGKRATDGFDSFSLPANSLAEGDILGLVLGDKRALPEAVNLLAERRDSLPDLACRLLRAARLVPAGLLTRMSMKDSHQLHHFSENYQIPMLDFHEITSLKRDIEVEMSITTSARLPLAVTEEAKIVMFRQKNDRQEHFAILVGSEDFCQPPLVRLHSQCVTGDVLGSLKCDCGPQLHSALSQMGVEDQGVLLYLNQEGRGIGLTNKMRAYALQDKGFDTVEANHRLGFEDDERDFRIGAALLREMGISQSRLMTNNPKKIEMMEKQGIKVVERVPLRVGEGAKNRAYLATKAAKSGHLL